MDLSSHAWAAGRPQQLALWPILLDPLKTAEVTQRDSAHRES